MSLHVELPELDEDWDVVDNSGPIMHVDEPKSAVDVEGVDKVQSAAVDTEQLAEDVVFESEIADDNDLQVPKKLQRYRKRLRIVDDSDDERKAKPAAKHAKRRWTDDEHNLVMESFGNDITNKVMPCGSRLEAVLRRMGTGRTLAQIRTYVHNYVSGKVKM